MQLDKYIADIKEKIDQLGKWPSKMLTERSIEITYTENNIRLAGRIIVAFSVPNGHVNVRVSFYNYNCVRKESIVMRELSVDSVVKQIDSFVDTIKENLIDSSTTSYENRHKLGALMETNGYNVDCESKYMSVYKGKGIKITFKFTDDADFSVILSKLRKKRTETDIMFSMKFPSENDTSWKVKLETGIENLRKLILQ